MRIRLTELKRIIRSEVRRALREGGEDQDQAEIDDVKAGIEAALKKASPEEIEDAKKELAEGIRHRKFMREDAGEGSSAGSVGLTAGMIAAACAAFGFGLDPYSAPAIFLATTMGTAWLVDKLEKAGLVKT